MAKNITEILENELQEARNTWKTRRETGTLTAGQVKEARFYHNSKTRHNGGIFHLANGETVYKEFRETDFLEVAALFTRIKEIVVWYDKDKMVQQFVLNHNY